MCECDLRGIGSHINRSKTLLETIANAMLKNIQIFITPPRSFKIMEITDSVAEDCLATKQFILTNNINVFIHSPYIVNIANPSIKYLNCMKNNFDIGKAMGAKGIIIHVGKSLQLPEEEAYFNSKKAVLQLLEHATPECKLILETPAGQGSEMFMKMEHFANFVKEFKEYPNFGVCVDTCHVWSSGYIPIEYIQGITDLCINIDIIHLNDSQNEFGKGVDRHAFPGQGYIGPERIQQVINWSKENGVPMVIE